MDHDFSLVGWKVIYMGYKMFLTIFSLYTYTDATEKKVKLVAIKTEFNRDQLKPSSLNLD